MRCQGKGGDLRSKYDPTLTAEEMISSWQAGLGRPYSPSIITSQPDSLSALGSVIGSQDKS